MSGGAGGRGAEGGSEGSAGRRTRRTGSGVGRWARRADRAERMDAPKLDRGELAHSLRQVAAANRWLGGTRGLRRTLEPIVAGAAHGVLLDVGTGNGEVLREIVGWARQIGGAGWWGVGIDHHPDVIAVAARADRRRASAEGRNEPSSRIRLTRADALRLPFADGAFDAAFSSLTLHHFSDGEAREVVAEMARVSKRLVVVSDLERTRMNHLGARTLALTWWRNNRLTRHDAPLSVLRSFTVTELEEVGRGAGLCDPSVRRFFPFRLVLEGTP